MISLPVAAAVGAALGAVALGTASAMTHGTIGLDIALSHIPSAAHGYDVVSTVCDALAGGAAGGGIGAAVAHIAKGLSIARGP